MLIGRYHVTVVRDADSFTILTVNICLHVYLYSS